MKYEVAEITDIVDELIRLGLVKEVWHLGDAEPKYVVTKDTKDKGVE